MADLVVVGIADQNITMPPKVLITYALGSCIGICLYDRFKKIAGLAHILLPYSSLSSGPVVAYKYADTAIDALLNRMVSLGCDKRFITAKIAGGANMFEVTGKSIGERNIEAVKETLKSLKITIVAEDVGGNYGRTVEFNPENGMLTIRSIGKPLKII